MNARSERLGRIVTGVLAEALRVTAFTDARGAAELLNAKGLPLRVEVKAPGRAAKIVVTTAETA